MLLLTLTWASESSGVLYRGLFSGGSAGHPDCHWVPFLPPAAPGLHWFEGGSTACPDSKGLHCVS